MSKEKFDVIILIGRPAAGKSEVIDALKKADTAARLERYHIGGFEEIDDFPFIWDIFESDDILTAMGKPRKWTDDEFYFTDDHAWDFFLEKINHAYTNKVKDAGYHQRMTSIVEFARGGKDAFGHALSVLDKGLLRRAGIVYIKVSYDESCRKNRRRFDPEQPGSILHHSLPDDKMERYYRHNDWEEIAEGRSGTIAVKKDGEVIPVPFSVLENEPEVTDDPDKLLPALDKVFERLWEVYKSQG